MSEFRVEVRGLDVLLAGLRRFPREIARYLRAAGEEAGKEVIKTEGLKRYPPLTAANLPPPPYYIRGEGTFTGRRLRRTSERYGSRFYVSAYTGGARAGNDASYARYLGGEKQARHMARIGWRRLIDVAREKLPKIARIYDAWVEKAIRDLGLR